jgi:hypothetical protein
VSDPVLHKQLLDARQKYLQERLPLVVVTLIIPVLAMIYVGSFGERVFGPGAGNGELHFHFSVFAAMHITLVSIVSGLGAVLAIGHARIGPVLIFWGLIPIMLIFGLITFGCGALIPLLLVMQAYRVMRATELLTAHGFPLNRLKHLKDFPNKTLR